MDNTLNLPLNNLTCVLCLSIFRNPHKVGCDAEHSYCLKCLLELWDVQEKKFYNTKLRTTQKCPTCRSSVKVEDTRPDLITRRMVSNIQQQCKYVKNGCTFFCEPGSKSFEEHIRACR